MNSSHILTNVSLILLAGCLSVAAGRWTQKTNRPAQAESENRVELSDKDLAMAIETSLSLDNQVPADSIDVHIKNGIATLSGSVTTIPARKKAGDLAGNIFGIKSVVNLIKIDPVERSDKELLSDIAQALNVDPATDSYDVDVDVQDSVAILSGSVESYHERTLAEDIAENVKGVKEVDNRIKISYNKDRPDDKIQSEIEMLLESDVRINARLVDVTVKDAKVKLTGSVSSTCEKNMASSLAWVPGVQSVNSEPLNVRAPGPDEVQGKSQAGRKPDPKIEKHIQTALRQNPRVYSFKIGVDSKCGIVTLTGIVDNLAAKKAAEKNAANTVGVWRVKNLIKVRPAMVSTDKEITEKIEAALSRNPYVDRYDLTASAHGGKARLSGDVDSQFEKELAEEVVWRIKGVVDVQNNLKINAAWPEKEDWAIADDARDQLYWNIHLDEDNVTVEVRDGVAILKGQVRSWYARSEAARCARQSGAKRVENNLRVDNGPETY